MIAIKPLQFKNIKDHIAKSKIIKDFNDRKNVKNLLILVTRLNSSRLSIPRDSKVERQLDEL